MNSLVDNLLIFLYKLHIFVRLSNQKLSDLSRNIGLVAGTCIARIKSWITPTTTTKPSVRSYDEESCKSTAASSLQHDETTSAAAACNEIVVVSSSSNDADAAGSAASAGGPTDALSRTDVRKSKSKMKIYLKKCKDALIGQPMSEDTCPITHHEAVSQSPNTSWYLDDEVQSQPQPNAASRGKCELDADIKMELGHENNLSKDGRQLNSVIENVTGGDVQATIEGCGVANLVDKYLGHLYPEYYDHTRTVLIRQARDILVCTFHGNLARFEERFLQPTAGIVARLKELCQHGSLLTWRSGWPLVVSGALVLHLGALDESLVRSQDLYICIRAEQARDEDEDNSEVNLPKLYAVWRSSTNTQIVYHQLDPNTSSLSPLSIEMLAEDLPQLLQNLLVGVERAICRVPLDDLSFPSPSPTTAATVASTAAATTTAATAAPTLAAASDNNNSVDDYDNRNENDIIESSSSSAATATKTLNHNNNNKLILSPINLPKKFECGIKRREIITKYNNNNKYSSLKRVDSAATNTQSNSNNKSEIDIKNSLNKNDLINGNRSGEQTSIATAVPGNSASEASATGSAAAATTTTTASSSPATTPTAAITNAPLFCLGDSFPHIDSDEESGDDTKKIETVSHLPHDIVAPRSIQDLPEKLLMSGIYLPGTHDCTGTSIITIEVDKVFLSGLNCYEIATVLLYYSTIPISTTNVFTLHLIINESSHLTILDILDNSLQLIHGHIKINTIYISCPGSYKLTDAAYQHQLVQSKANVKYLRAEEQFQTISEANLPIICGGAFKHDQLQWKEFFSSIELLQLQCITTGKRLINVLSDIRNMDLQGQPSRRQLHSQHRALSRALMDSELQNLRRKGPTTVTRLQERSKRINNRLTLNETKNQNINNNNNSNTSLNNNNNNLPQLINSININTNSSNNINNNKNQSLIDIDNNGSSNSCNGNNNNNNDFITIRLNEVIVLFNEVDLAAKKLEQLTEQRRERLREMTRQRALEEEINEVISWIRNDGENSLIKYNDITLECADLIREQEQEFEKYYFISMKHMAKGRDLCDAAADVEQLNVNAGELKDSLTKFNEKLEKIRERIEGAARLHHLISLKMTENDVQQEMQKLAEKIGVPGLIEQCKQIIANKQEATLLASQQAQITATSTPDKQKSSNSACAFWNDNNGMTAGSAGAASTASSATNPITEKNGKGEESNLIIDEDEEDHSKMADSGLGGCDRCEGNEKMVRACSCQSFEDATNACDKSNNSDDLDEDCFDNSAKQQDQVPMQANAHLYCHASSLQLDLEENKILDPKTQKTLLLIMREMIGTERDYVRSLRYVIENYIQELLREDIPQALRGQRNVIFGNIERIYEFHQHHFLKELEHYEHHPLKVGASFLRHESKFYLYALYNKNKPKSDSLMSEYGTMFFKSKQNELNDKMDLASYLLKPVQRMGKYALLLQQLMKACSGMENITDQEFIEDLEELQKAEEMVRFQLRHGNDLLAMDSLRDCDVNVKEQGRLLRQSEFLVWEGRGGKKSLRQVFLFEDLVLFSKARRFPDRKNLDIYIYKNSIKTSDIGLTAHVSDSPTKFEIWFRKRKPGDTWTLQSMSEDVKNAWTDEISKLLWKQAKRNREIRLAEMSSMGIGSKPCLDIRPSKDQINDRSISVSQLAPKFRNSFAGTLPEIKSARRPNSIISDSSSSSGGSSVVSTSTGSSGASSAGTNVNSKHSNSGMESNLMPTANLNHCKKHQRSTTLVSQCSMESGILADISLSPDECPDPTNWPNIAIRKSHSTSSADQKLGVTMTGGSDEKSTIISNPDPYLNNDSITVHL